MRLKIQLILIVLVSTMIYWYLSNSVFAAGPVIEIIIEEKISVGEPKSPTINDAINEAIAVKDEVDSGYDAINEAIAVKDKVDSDGGAINEAIAVNDEIISEIQKNIVPTPATANRVRTTIKAKSTSIPANKTAVIEKTDIKAAENRSEVKPTPTPKAKKSRWNIFNRGTGRAVGMDSASDQSDSVSGSCNGTGNNGFSLLSMLVFPIALTTRRFLIKNKKRLIGFKRRDN
jgi:hypothetical protein